ncbi:MAG: hypothetical protein KA536_15760 [Saprospiraceae bacterium]|nr:hypothetical protein [Saprospiraceae bacterium]
MKTNQNPVIKPVTPQDDPSEVLHKGTLSSSSIASYRTKDGRSIFKFQYARVGNYYEIDILSHPHYGSRNASQQIAHWLPSLRSGGKKICVSIGKEPRTLDAAKDLSIGWAELTNIYIKTGQTIDEQVMANHRKSGFFGWLFG